MNNFIKYFSLFSQYNFNNRNIKKRRWCACDSNPGPQDGRRRQNHRAMAATHFEKYFTIIIYKSRAVLSWKLNLHITTLESLFTIIEYLKISIYIKQKRSSLLVKQKRSILFSSNQPIYQHSTIVIYESRVVLTGKLRRVLLQIRKLR